MGILLDFIEERLNQARANMQPQSNRVISFRQNSPVKRAVPLFGADGSNEFEDWASYRTPKLNGPGTQPLQAELKVVDSDIDKWDGRPNPNLPVMPSHGRRLDYEKSTDQQPISKGILTPADVWDGVVRSNVPKKSLESSRPTGKTIGDEIAESWNKVETYDFRF